VVSEIGHVTIDFNGPQCRCGNIGCLELYSNFHNIIDRYAARTGTVSTPGRELENEEASARIAEIFRRAGGGEDAAREVIRAHGQVLSVGAVTLANTFSPEMIIVSANDLGNIDLSILLAEIQEAVRGRAFSVIADKIKVVASTLGRDVTLYGGIALVLQDFFSNIAA
jgi:N-acetylglucosamine repressor